MASTNPKAVGESPKTHEGAQAVQLSSEKRLRRSVMACMLFENEFYEDGVSIAERISDLVGKTPPEKVAEIAVEARRDQHLRHAPLLLAKELAVRHYPKIRELLRTIIMRPDELTEFLSLYWGGSDRKKARPIQKGVRKGLKDAFEKFDEYRLAKYQEKDKAIKLRDVMKLVHPKPSKSMEEAYKALAANEMAPPDTWEVQLSAGKDKKETFERLMAEKKLGGFACLRNLRNMKEAGIPVSTIGAYMDKMDVSQILPFRFVAAAKAAPGLEEAIDKAMLRSMREYPKMDGRTVIVIDVSGSMYNSLLSAKSDMDRAVAAAALGAIGREMFSDVAVYATAGNDSTRVHKTQEVPSRHGMALVDAIHGLSRPLGGGGIFLNQVCNFLRERESNVERMIVVTDEQDCGNKASDSPLNAVPIGEHNYLLNVASAKNGIGYGRWTHIDGWSESCFRFIQMLEANNAQ